MNMVTFVDSLTTEEKRELRLALEEKMSIESIFLTATEEAMIRGGQLVKACGSIIKEYGCGLKTAYEIVKRYRDRVK